jgi:hypothetical protein
MLSVIANIYNKKTKGLTLMELFTATGKQIFFFWQLEMFAVCTTGDTAHIDMIFKLLPHTHHHVILIAFTLQKRLWERALCIIRKYIIYPN